nr:tyrosine-type recombinase/integrase [Neobacillus soli]
MIRITAVNAEIASFFVVIKLLHFSFVLNIFSKLTFSLLIHPHQLRHSYATPLLKNGAPLDVIQSLLGHEKSEATRIYAQLSGIIKREFL